MLSNLGITPRKFSFEPTQTFFWKVRAIQKWCQNNYSRRCHLQPFFGADTAIWVLEYEIDWNGSSFEKSWVLKLLNLLLLLSYGASFNQFITIKTFSRQIYISCVHRDTYLYLNFEKHIRSFSWLFLQSFLDHHHFFFFFFFYRLSALSFIQVWWCQVSCMSLENPLSDSYMFIRTLTRLTIYMYYSRLLVYEIVNVSLWFSYIL